MEFNTTHNPIVLYVVNSLHLFFLKEALFGEAPFASETLEELHMKVLDERPVQVREVVRK